jgi:lipopolysaccharide/colanic/teichoic acid biosynthesis glycosyltransferase
MLLIALSIKIESEGPVFYVAERIGRWGKPFRCLKFRTMIVDADRMQQTLGERNERDTILFKMRKDPRLTRIGGFLRKYSLDELPQLFNVLRGEMSMVGPRPPLPREVAKYSLEHLHRLTVTPGVTGLWQVQGRQDNSFTKYIALDMAYVKNWSLLLDLKILIRTVDVVLRGTGV